MSGDSTVFEQVGGMKTFEALVAAFYEGVAEDEVLRPMYPADLEEPRRHLALFLAQYFGGPGTYSEERGHPRLRMRHVPFTIGRDERERWLKHMLGAVDRVAIAEPARGVMVNYFNATATGLMNVPTFANVTPLT